MTPKPSRRWFLGFSIVLVVVIAGLSAALWIEHSRAAAEMAAIKQQLDGQAVALRKEHDRKNAEERQAAQQAQNRRAVQAVIEQHQSATQQSFKFWTNYTPPTLLTAPYATTLGSELPGMPKPKPPHADAPMSVKVSDYVKRLRQIDCADTPQDFQLAFLEYVQAWDRKLAFMGHGTDNRDLMALIGLLGWAAGVPGIGLAGASGAVHEQQAVGTKGATVDDRIRESWYKVESAAVTHGVPIRPANAQH